MFEKPFLRTPYNYDRNDAGDESGLSCKDPTRTKQSFKEEADINTIVKRFKITGRLPENVRMPVSADFDQIVDFQTAMNVIRQGQEAFAEMPANIRARFSNDPARFVEFCLDPENRAEATKMGLVDPTIAQAPPPAGGTQGGSTPPAPVAPAASSPITKTP